MRNIILSLLILFLIFINISCINPFPERLDASLTITSAEDKIEELDLRALTERLRKTQIMEPIDIEITDELYRQYSILSVFPILMGL